MEDLQRIYQENAQTVYKFLLVQTRNPQLAEELTQETFYQAVRSVDRFDGSCKMSVWLCQIAKHVWYKHLRKSRHEAPAEDELPDIPLPSAEETVLEQQGRVELLQKIHALPEPGREVVYLRVFGGLSFREIGDVLGRTESWARVTFYRAKERLQGGIHHE